MTSVEIEVTIRKVDGKWEIRVSGVSSGCEVNFGDGDNGNVKWFLDASRFKPVLIR